MTADPELGLVYVVTNGVTIDYYGGHHPGDNLFSTSVIALDAETGERRWHYQFIHHDIWNYDTSQPPMLMDVVVDGRPVKGLFQATKQAFLYALDRETGEPIWPIDERPVPASTVPGERLSPTQPFPTTPPPFDLQGRDESMLIDYTPEIHERALQVARENDLFAPLFDPPTVAGDPAGPAWQCPSGGGGANIFGNVSADPTRGLMFVPSTNRCGRLSGHARQRVAARQSRADGQDLLRLVERRRPGGSGAAGRPDPRRAAHLEGPRRAHRRLRPEPGRESSGSSPTATRRTSSRT